jgi:hypothetical protein
MIVILFFNKKEGVAMNSISVFKVKMGGTENAAQIVTGLGYPFHKLIPKDLKDLTSESSESWESIIEIIDPGFPFSEEEGLQILKDRKLVRPTYEHPVRFRQQYKEVSFLGKKSYVIFLHEPWFDSDGDRRIVCVGRVGWKGGLYLDCLDGRFYGHSVLVGVHP